MGYNLLQNDTEFMKSWDVDLDGVDIQADETASEYARYVDEKLYFILDESLRSLGFDHNNPEDCEFLKKNLHNIVTYDGLQMFYLDHPELGTLKIVWMERLDPPVIGLEIKGIRRL